MKKPNKIELLLIAIILGIAGIGLAIDRVDFPQPLQTALQSPSISTGMLDYGTMGQVLKRLNLVNLVENDFQRFKPTDDIARQIDFVTFQKKRQVSRYLYDANIGANAGFKSTVFIKDRAPKRNWPIISIAVNVKDLNDPEYGIWVNREKKGREWERTAEVTYVENGEIKFESYAGLRIHGGQRLINQDFKPGFRLYFRKKYGLKNIPAGLVLPHLTIPLRTLVIQTTAWPPGYPMNNPLAYDISQKIGCVAPDTQLVEIYLNGKSYGMGYATEHLSRRQWGQRLGHDDYLFFVYRNQNPIEDSVGYANKIRPAIYEELNPYLSEVGQTIDLDNLTKQLISWVFSGTNDYCQGVAVYDRKRLNAKLNWINWDMDHSFYDHGAVVNNLHREPWQQPGLNLFFRGSDPKKDCWRVSIFHRLLKKSSEYKIYYIKSLVEALNHLINREFLSSRVDYYQNMLVNYGEPHEEYMKMLETFMNERPYFLLLEFKEKFDLHGPFACNVIIPNGSSIEIDGYTYDSDYNGYYYNSTPVILNVPEPLTDDFQYWLVNGKKTADRRLQLQLSNDTTIAPIFN